MSNTSLRILAFSALVIWGGSIAAQTGSEQIRVLGIYANGKLQMHWAPSNFAIWNPLEMRIVLKEWNFL